MAACDQIVQPLGAELLEVLVECHATVEHDHLSTTKAADPCFECVEHGRQAEAVLGVAVEDLVRLGEAVAIDDQAHDHLFAIGTFVARVTALGLGVVERLALEVRGGQVIEENGLVEVEQLSLAFDQVRLDECALGVEPIHVAPNVSIN